MKDHKQGHLDDNAKRMQRWATALDYSGSTAVLAIGSRGSHKGIGFVLATDPDFCIEEAIELLREVLTQLEGDHYDEVGRRP